MIAANQFLRDEFPSSHEQQHHEDGHNGNQDGFFQVSAHSFLLGDRNGRPNITATNDGMTNMGNHHPLLNADSLSATATAERVLATMDEFLTRQSTMMQPPPVLHHYEPPQLQTPPAWLTTLEPLLRQESRAAHRNGFLTNTFSLPATAGSSDKALADLSSNRQGVIISKPWRLSTKTLIPPEMVQSTNTDETSKQWFCLPALQPLTTSNGNKKTADFEFDIYPESYQNETTKTNSSSYAPPGYEEFSTEVVTSTEENHSTNVVYIMEIQNASSSLATGVDNGFSGRPHDRFQRHNCTELESIAVVFSNDDPKWTNARGIHVKLLTSTTFLQIIKAQQQPAIEPTALIAKLQTVPSLSLPHKVGCPPPPNGGSEQHTPSIIAVVTVGDGQSSGVVHWDDSIDRIRAYLILKFRKNEILLDNPLESNVARAHFCIGRSIHISTHTEAENELKQKLWQDALRNAERFVPQWKREQWDAIPDALITVSPHQLMPWQLREWLLDPLFRRSHFDLAIANVLLYLFKEFHPPNCCYFDKHTVSQDAINQLLNWRHAIVQNVNFIKQSAEGVSTSPIDANALKRFCIDVENGEPKALQVGHDAEKCLTFLGSYVQRMLAGLKIERLRCLDDMKKHDMYSILWNNDMIGIAPPVISRLSCDYCKTKRQQFKKKVVSPCAYHRAAEIMTEERPNNFFPPGPVFIRTRNQLEMLPIVLGLMVAEDRLITKITVPGVAEEFPLISIGDLVRLVFRDAESQISTEVVAEVVDVVVKSEVVTLALPSPFHRLGGSSVPWTTMSCLPYLKSLLRTNQYYLNAPLIMKLFPGSILSKQSALPISNNLVEQCRFDARFGFLGGRGFDIVAEALGEMIGPLPHTKGINRAKRHHEETCARCALWQRALTPTKELLKNARQSQPPGTLNWATPVNREQQLAVGDIVQRRHGSAPYIINGPAGTGKTMCVVEAIVQILSLDPNAKILVCAPSDAACDVITKRVLPLLREGLVVRINWWARKLASLPPELLSCSSTDNNTGVFNLPSHNAATLASVLICQCFVAESLETLARRGWMKHHFTHLFIDETSQAMECEALVPMLKVGLDCSIVLSGDPKQLGPTVRDPVAARIGLGISIQERLLSLPLYKNEKNMVMTLTGNYRSNEALLTVPSALFYGGSLRALAGDDVTNLDIELAPAGLPEFPLLLCNVAHGENRNKLDTPSFYNMEECAAILHLIQGLLQCATKVAPDGKRTKGLHTGEIAVITPFRAQVLAVRTVLRRADLGGVNVGVVEDFQGQEAKVVFISTVLTEKQERWTRTNSTDSDGAISLGFMQDPKRFNVAVTRAQALCVIVGHAAFLEQSGTYWTAIIDHITRNNGAIGGTSSNGEAGLGGPDEDEDIYGVAELLRCVEELRLLGAGSDEDQHDLAFYYTDTPQWKVMLS